MEAEKDSTPAIQQDNEVEKRQADKLYFSFAASKWSDVIEWLAESGNLALHVDELPKGTFTYSDTNGFTLQEAIDRINLFLLPEGFTLIRSGRLLSVINLSDAKSARQLDTLSRLVSVDELDKLEDHDLVKCLFPLGELKTDEAVEELSALNLIKTPDVFNKTNQILITDTAGKLKLARKILSAFDPGTLDNGTVVKSFTLKHVNAEDVLTVARPHLGLATGEMIGIDVSISADLLGKNIFVTGVEDKVRLIEGLIQQIDVGEIKKTGDAVDILQSHRVTGGNVDLVYNVLQTLLADQEIRLSVDSKSQSIVALAPANIQKEIANTVTQLQAAEAQFAVIPLKHVDPYFVITLLEQMLDLDDDSYDTQTESGRDSDRRRGWGDWRGWGGGMLANSQNTSVDPPKVDADPGGMKLFVLGTEFQIEQIKQIVNELDVPDKSSLPGDSRLRIFPVRGERAVNAVETAARFWRDKNSIIFYPTVVPKTPRVKEKIIADDAEKTTDNQDYETQKPLGAGRVLSKQLGSDEPPIQIQITDRGLLVQSEDIEALDKFEEILRTVIGPIESISSAPIIYYLKYATPDEAIRMLAEMLDGGDTANDSESGTLVNGLVLGSSDTFFGSLVSSREGTMTLTYGNSTIIADTRLNRLIAQGSVDELEKIEAYLKIIDKDKSITSIEIYGTSHVIELENVDANDVAETLKKAYFGRVLGETSANQNGARQQPRSQPQPNRNNNPQEQPEDRDGRDRNQGRENNRNAQPQNRGSSGTASKNEPKMTIAVHEASNSLIITAPEPLFKEVEKLVKLIDTKSVQTVEIIKLSRPLANDIQQILSGESPAPQNRSNSGAGTSSNRPTPPERDFRSNRSRNR